jgi:hypothetical protein
MCQTTYYLLWNDSASIYWLKALSLPVLPWTKILLPVLGLSENLLKNLTVWEPIISQAILEDHKKLQAKKMWEDGERGEVIRDIVLEALKSFESQCGKDSALELERWARRNFFCLEVEMMINAWRRILRFAMPDSYSSHDYVPIPVSLAALIPEIEQAIGFETGELFLQLALNAARDYARDDHDELVNSYEFTMLKKVVRQERVIKVFKLVADRLSPIAIQELVRWSMLQASAFTPPMNPVHLYGDKYLRREPPCFDTISIANIPTPGHHVDTWNQV